MMVFGMENYIISWVKWLLKEIWVYNNKIYSLIKLFKMNLNKTYRLKVFKISYKVFTKLKTLFVLKTNLI